MTHLPPVIHEPANSLWNSRNIVAVWMVNGAAPGDYVRMRLKLDYDDQNEELRTLLPINGTVVRQAKSVGHGDWDMLQLDKPLVYRQARFDWLLLRSRWVGRAIGDAEGTSVFVAVVRDPEEISDGFCFNERDHIAWGMVTPLPRY